MVGNKVHTTTVKHTYLPNLDRVANFLEDLPAFWLHPGVTHEDLEVLVKQVFQRITIDGKECVDMEAKPEYALLLLPSGIGLEFPESNRGYVNWSKRYWHSTPIAFNLMVS